MNCIKNCGLVDFLLNVVRIRPAMYLGEAKISRLTTFISGYQIGYFTAMQDGSVMDEYFGRNGFLEWFYRKYNIENKSFWEIPFLEMANHDDAQALLIYFEYLEKYRNVIKMCGQGNSIYYSFDLFNAYRISLLAMPNNKKATVFQQWRNTFTTVSC